MSAKTLVSRIWVFIVKHAVSVPGAYNLKIGVRGANYVQHYNKSVDARMIEIGSRVDKLDSVWEGKFLTTSLSNAAESQSLDWF